MKNYFNTVCYFTIVLTFFLSCKKDENIDIRDKYVGHYSGIQVYIDYQQHIQDTSDADVYLTKLDIDTISAIELKLPNSNERYIYDVKNDSLVFHGVFYHCPILTIINDTLICEWSPSLAPRIYRYKMIKVKESNN
jgi:hypothetical protein